MFKNFPLISLSKQGEIRSIASLRGSFVAVAVDNSVIVVDTRDAYEANFAFDFAFSLYCYNDVLSKGSCFTVTK